MVLPTRKEKKDELKKNKRARRKKEELKMSETATEFLTIEKPEGKDEKEHNVLLSFVTKQQQYAVPKHPLSVSEDTSPKDMNVIVSEMLTEGNFEGTPPIFDFLVGDSMLHTKLAHKLNNPDSNVSREGMILVEYVEQLPPPQPQDTLAHDDWVCDLHSHNGFLITGCYDNSIHIWRPKMVNKKKETVITDDKSAHRLKIGTAHRAGVKAVSWLPKSEHKFISGSIDQSVLLWQWNKKDNSVRCIYRCRGHVESVESLAVRPDGLLFTSGSWDGEIRLWSTDSRGETAAEPENKKRKAVGEGKPVSKEPLCIVKDHTQVVMGMVWSTLTTLASCSYDNSVRLWDVEQEMCQLKQYVAPAAVVSIHSSPFNNTLLITTIDRHVRLLDPREENLELVKTYRHHKRFASRVRWSPQNEQHFVTSGMDNIVKLWDLRSPSAPLYEMLSHQDRVLALDWCNSGTIFSGGADCNVKMFSP